MDRSTEAEWLEKAIAGDAHAFEYLVDHYYMKVYALAYKYTGVREDAEDIAQEAVIKAARSIGNFRGDAGFGSWLYRITLNTAHDMFRKKGRKQALESAFEMEAADNTTNITPEDHARSRDLYRQIAKLPEKQKDAVLLVCAERLNHQEAAEILGCSEKTVSWRIFQARKTLKKMLDH